MTDRIEQEAAHEATRRRKQLELGDRPAGDMVAVLEASGLKVFALPLGDDAPWGMYVPREGWCGVLLNSRLLEPQLRVAAAHELAHYAFGDGPHLDDASTMALSDGDTASGHGAGSAKVERRAEAFARWFLLPDAALRKAWGGPERREQITPDDVLRLATEYGVTYKLVTAQLQSAGWISGNQRRGLESRREANIASVLRRPAKTRAFPSEYVEGALQAYARQRISFDRLVQLLRGEPAALRTILKENQLLRAEDDAPDVEETAGSRTPVAGAA